MIDEICLAGACHRGIAYTGSLKCLEDLNLISKDSLKKVVGVSLGSFVALCYLIGYSPDDMMNLTLNSDISSFKDFSFLNSEEGLALLRGKIFRKWVYESIAEKIDPETTMKQLYEKTNIHFIVPTTSVANGLVHFDYINTPNVSVCDAVISSMNFPGVFPRYVHQFSEHHDDNGDSYLDGGVLDNFPMYLLGPDALGFKVNFKKINNIDESPMAYTGKIFEIMSKYIHSLKPSNSEHIIEIDTSDFTLLEFDMSVDDKMTLYKRGYNSVKHSKITKVLLENLEKIEKMKQLELEKMKQLELEKMKQLEQEKLEKIEKKHLEEKKKFINSFKKVLEEIVKKVKKVKKNKVKKVKKK